VVTVERAKLDKGHNWIALL